MTEYNREHGQRWGQGEQGSSRGPNEGERRQWGSSSQQGSFGSQQSQGQPGHGQDIASNFGSGQQAQGGYGQGSYGYGQGGSGGNPASGGQSGQDAGRMSSMFSGSSGHRGKAPGGYQRSDERLREMICERLMEEPSIDASDVEISVQGGRATLEGTIDSRLAKYQIEDIVEHMGVSDVQNNLRVARDKQTQGQVGEHGSGPESQSGSSGGVSSLGMSGSGVAGGDRTATGGTNAGGSTRSSSPQ